MSIRCLILAAGSGRRLIPHTLNKPKALVTICGKSLLERQLAVLKSRKITDISIVAGYKYEMLERFSPNIYLNNDYATTNMVASLSAAREILNDAVIISYGDIVYSGRVLDKLLACDGEVSVAIDSCWKPYWSARMDDIMSDVESLKLDSGGKIVEIGQVPVSLKEIQGQYIGLVKFSKRAAIRLKSLLNKCLSTGSVGMKSFETAYFTDLLQELIDIGESVTSVPFDDPWIEVDTGEDLTNPVNIARVESIDFDLRP